MLEASRRPTWRIAAIKSEFRRIGPTLILPTSCLAPKEPVASPLQSPRLYLEIADGDSAETRLRAALAAAPIEAVLIAQGATSSLGSSSLRALVALAQHNNAAALVGGDAQLAMSSGADGVHLRWSQSLSEDYAAARAVLGQSRIVGVEAGGSKHDAMTLAEMGADYIAFGPGGAGLDGTEQAELVAWWAEVFEVPCVGLSVTEAETAVALAAAGADFIGVRLDAGLSSEAVSGRIRAISAAIAAPSAGTAPVANRGEA